MVISIVSAEDVSNAIEGEVSWPQSGSVDSGWIELSTTPKETTPLSSRRHLLTGNLSLLPALKYQM